MKKAFALILTLALVMSLSITAFAAPTNGTITIQNPQAVTYGAYRLLVLDSQSGDNYSYKANPTYKAFLDTICLKDAAYKDGEVTEAAKALIKIDAAGYVTPMYNGAELTSTDGTAWAKEVGKLFKAYIDANDTAAEKTVTSDGKTAVFTDMAPGYYYISTNVGSLVSLGSVNGPSATIEEKNVNPTITKKVIESDSPVDANSAASSEVLTFVVTIDVKEGAENYIVEDTLGGGLGAVDPDAVKVEYAADSTFADVPAANTANASKINWKASYDSASRKLTVAFDNEYLATLTGGKLQITYTSLLTASEGNTDAVTGNVNTAALKYGHDPKAGTDDPDHTGETLPVNPPHATTETKTTTLYYSVTIQKFTGDATAATRLKGAGFKVYDDETAGNQIKLTSNANGKAVVDTNGSTDAVLVDDNGQLVISGLDVGTYWLEEAVVPAGYNKPAGRIKITIADKDLTDDAAEITPSAEITFGEGDAVTAIGVENKSGNVLPSTGGIGTTIFYTVGAVLMASALVLLITKKKMSAN